MTRFFIFSTLVLAVFSSGAAAQPFSKSMAECAGLYAFGRDYVDRAETVQLLEYGQAKWVNAAIVQAQEEGVANPTSYVDAAMEAKYAEWQGKGVMAVFSEELGDWMDYCRSFADHRGIVLDPS